MQNKHATTDECRTREQIVLFVDGLVSSAEGAGVESHVAACSSCLRLLNEEKALLGTIDRIMGDLSDPVLPDGFAAAVTTAAESEIHGLRSATVRKGFMIAAAMLAVCSAILFVTGNSAVVGLSFGLGAAVLKMTSVLLHSLRDFSVGVVGVCRSLCLQFVPASQAAALALAVVFISSLAACSRLLSRQERS